MRVGAPMTRTILAAALLALPPVAQAGDGSRTMTAVPAPSPGWFVCDGIDAPTVILGGTKGGDGTAAFTTLSKRTGRAITARYAVGDADPGAGQVYYGLSADGREIGSVHAVNPGMVEPPGRATTPLVTSVTIGARAAQCRWRADTVANGVTARRGVSITREGGVIVYRSFDFARPSRRVNPDGVQRTSRPSLELRGGAARALPDGRREWRFGDRGHAYVVSARADASDAVLAVSRGGRVVRRERFLGITLAR